MEKLKSAKVLVAVLFISLLFACRKDTDKVSDQVSDDSIEKMVAEDGANPDELMFLSDATLEVGNAATLDKQQQQKNHFVYSLANTTGTNKVLVFRIKNDGALRYQDAVASGGAGTGMGLGSQGAIAINEEKNLLFAVNAGSNSISSFKILDDGQLKLSNTINSGGRTPNSLTIYRGTLYVLNLGSDNIHGFHVSWDGSMTHIMGSTKPLSEMMVDAPQISFTPNGRWLVVTEKATNKISSFKVMSNGSVSSGIFTASTGKTPFGFAFARKSVMVVSNAAGGAAGAGSATAYNIKSNGIPDPLNGAVENWQGAPCWVATTEHGRFAFISNTGSNSISSYYVAPWGSLYLIKKAATSTGMAPSDIVVAANNYFVYAVNGKSASIGAYHRTRFGGLRHIGDVSGLPAGVTGLATY